MIGAQTGSVDVRFPGCFQRPRGSAMQGSQLFGAAAAWGLGLALAAGATGADPADARAREIAEANPIFASYVFGGDALPACDFEHPERLRELIGPYRIKTT